MTDEVHQGFAIVDPIMIAVATTTTIEHPTEISIEELESSAPFSTTSAIMAAVSVPLIKISMGITLLRILQGRAWAIFLYTLIGLQVILMIFVVIMHTTRCVPLQAVWRDTPGAKCWSVVSFRISLACSSAITVVTDLIFSLIPLTFIAHIKRSTRERMMIVILMACGLFASSASIAKAIVVQWLTEDGDIIPRLIEGADLALCSNIEEQVGIIAACLPVLKAPIHRLLLRLGLASRSQDHSDQTFTSTNSVRLLKSDTFHMTTDDEPSLTQDEPSKIQQAEEATVPVPEKDRKQSYDYITI
jgi:hypothetical protein